MSYFFLLLIPLAVLSAGALAYQLLALYCVWQFRLRKSNSVETALPPVTLLKPLYGAEAGLEKYLTSYFIQKYPLYEIIFAIRTEADPAVTIVNRLRQQYPHIPAQLLFTGEPPYTNAKVYSMEKMAAAASYDLLVITDSDTEIAPDYLQAVATEFADPRVGAVTHLYRGVAPNEFWAKLEALGMTTEFMAGVIVAEKLEGMKFALGPSMAIRQQCLADIGGFAAMRDYLADDFVLGHWADRAGWQVKLGTFIVDHHVSTTGFTPTFQHRLRWNRSTRFSRPAGYFGQAFTYALSWSLLLFGFFPSNLTLGWLAVTVAVRIWLALCLGRGVMQDATVLTRLWLLPLQDILSFASWWGGWMSREIIWRGERYRLLSDGKFTPVIARVTSKQN